MVEILARIARNNRVELIDEMNAKLVAPELTPSDAAFLARGILACAAALSGPHPPNSGVIGGDAHFPIKNWSVGLSNVNGEIVVILLIPPGIELTFQVPKAAARDLGAALVSQADGYSPAGGHSGSVH